MNIVIISEFDNCIKDPHMWDIHTLVAAAEGGSHDFLNKLLK